MTDKITNDLIYEVLKGLQAGQGKILERISSVESEIISLRKQVQSPRQEGFFIT